ncbi:unnamed protein product [Anisakis simplex]|uniref:Pepsin-I3 domain-containing protein n=1 Tax=Anisakis simplex TaxID=6269 RepID=A0A0M3K3Q6_ANISI|nr:unnamed protein product [Anisakis simplex]
MAVLALQNGTVCENGISRPMTPLEMDEALLFEEQLDAFNSVLNSWWYKLASFVNAAFFGVWPSIPTLPPQPEVPCFCPDVCGNMTNSTEYGNRTVQFY